MTEKPICFRLRERKDGDLIRDFAKINPKIDKSDIIRAALRHYFRMTKQKARNNTGHELKD